MLSTSHHHDDYACCLSCIVACAPSVAVGVAEPHVVTRRLGVYVRLGLETRLDLSFELFFALVGRRLRHAAVTIGSLAAAATATFIRHGDGAVAVRRRCQRGVAAATAAALGRRVGRRCRAEACALPDADAPIGAGALGNVLELELYQIAEVEYKKTICFEWW